MSGIETEIWLALKKHVVALPQGLPIAWPASTYEPDDEPYLAVSNVSAPPRRVFVGSGEHDRTGTLTIVSVQKIGQEIAVHTEIAAQIAAHFPEDTRIRYGSTCVRITERPQVIEGYRDGAYWRTPVNIRWRALR